MYIHICTCIQILTDLYLYELMHRVQGGFISPAIDERAADTQIEMSPELTSVDILDYTLTNHINFEAEINFLTKGKNVI
jgi:hypothetical protein